MANSKRERREETPLLDLAAPKSRRTLVKCFGEVAGSVFRKEQVGRNWRQEAPPEVFAF